MKIIYFIYKDHEGNYNSKLGHEEGIKKWKSNLEKWQIKGITEGILFEGSEQEYFSSNFPLYTKQAVLNYFIEEANKAGKLNLRNLEKRLFQKP